MGKYRIKDISGRMIGYAQSQSSEIAEGIFGFLLALIAAPILLFIIGLFVGLNSLWSWATHIWITPFPLINGLIVIAVLSIFAAIAIRILKTGRSDITEIYEPMDREVFNRLGINGKLYVCFWGAFAGAFRSGIVIGSSLFIALMITVLISGYDSPNIESPSFVFPLAPAIGVIWVLLTAIGFMFNDRDDPRRQRSNVATTIYYSVLFWVIAPLIGMIVLNITNNESARTFYFTMDGSMLLDGAVASVVGGTLMGVLVAPSIGRWATRWFA